MSFCHDVQYTSPTRSFTHPSYLACRLPAPQSRYLPHANWKPGRGKSGAGSPWRVANHNKGLKTHSRTHNHRLFFVVRATSGRCQDSQHITTGSGLTPTGAAQGSNVAGELGPHYNGRAPHGFAGDCRTGTGRGHIQSVGKPAAAMIQPGRYAGRINKLITHTHTHIGSIRMPH